jgi:putative flippase GtrA
MPGILKAPRKLVGFALFGALAGATYAVVLVVLVERLRMPVFLASALGFAIAIPVSYLGNRWVTYRSRNMMGPEALRFVVVQVGNLFITSLIVHVASGRFQLSPFAGVAVAFVAAPIVSFILFELWVYRQRDQGPGRHP